MKSIAIKQANRELQLVDYDLPPLRDGEVLVKTLATGICGTDRELLEYNRIIPPEGEDFLIIGHEAVGEVAEVGASVSQLRKGDIVVPIVRAGCGRCFFCNNGRSDMCSTGNYKERGILGLHGFMSEYFTEKELNLVRIPGALKSQAVLLEPLSVGIKAIEESFEIQKTRLYKNENVSEEEICKDVLVIGAGAVGLLTSLIMAHHNAKLTCIDIEEEDGVKSDIVKMMGGYYINLKKYRENDKINLEELCENHITKKIDLMFDASSDPLTSFQLMELLKFNGIAVLLGFPFEGKKNILDLGHFITSFVLRNQVLVGSVNSNKKHFERGKYYLEQSQKRFGGVLDKTITHRLPFINYQEAFNIESTGRIKVVLTWE